MNEKFIYLDHNATTPADLRVIEAMRPYFNELYGNPLSLYKFASKSREAVELAREKVAKLLNAEPNEIIFTSGGTEANNVAIKGVAHANLTAVRQVKKRGNHIITSKIEHPAVLKPCKWLESQGFKVTYISVDKYGVIDLDELRDAITDKTILISIMHANNEVGTIEPIEEISRLAKEHNVYFHTDAVQTVGKTSTNVDELGVDLLSLSGHKFYGPKGVGALYIRRGTKLVPFVHGGGHERNLRAGTHNVPGIVGLGKACEIAELEREEAKKLKRLRDKLYQGIMDKIPEVIFPGHPENRLAGTLSICVKYVEGESMLINLDFEGIAVSSGSACASGSLEPSHVLLAMGIPREVAHSSLRFSLGRDNTDEDIDKVLTVFPNIVKKLRKISPFGKHR
ncbi:cysteine desulfurase NifS [candidate division WOR-3 bacterium]|nr:cysteine desulfurase NifS [candidate division WOR-3 bacterium]